MKIIALILIALGIIAMIISVSLLIKSIKMLKNKDIEFEIKYSEKSKKDIDTSINKKESHLS